jgi:hypothetical protein
MSAATDEHLHPPRRRGAPGRAAAALALLVAAAVTGGCGLSTNDEPETIRDNVPPDLLDEAESASPGEATEDTETAFVWFLNTDSETDTYLVRAERQVPRPATQTNVLETLITEPPSEMERLDGISTDVPEDVTLTATPRQTSGGVLIVDLSEDFYELQGETARNAFAQIVFTATGLPGVDEVQFQRDGEVFNAVDGDGQSRRDPLGRNDFDKLQLAVAESSTGDPGGSSPDGSVVGSVDGSVDRIAPVGGA